MSGCGCGCSCGTPSKAAKSDSQVILEALAKLAGPCGSKDIIEATGLDKKVVTEQIAVLKKQGLVDSPVRCKYGITGAGKASF